MHNEIKKQTTVNAVLTFVQVTSLAAFLVIGSVSLQVKPIDVYKKLEKTESKVLSAMSRQESIDTEILATLKDIRIWSKAVDSEITKINEGVEERTKQRWTSEQHREWALFLKKLNKELDLQIPEDQESWNGPTE